MCLLTSAMNNLLFLGNHKTNVVNLQEISPHGRYQMRLTIYQFVVSIFILVITSVIVTKLYCILDIKR